MQAAQLKQLRAPGERDNLASALAARWYPAGNAPRTTPAPRQRLPLRVLECSVDAS